MDYVRILKKLRPRPLLVRLRKPRTGYLLSHTTQPMSRNFGLNRGSALDRYYIDRFLQENSADIQGRCLEVASDRYTVRYGGDRVTHRDVLDIDPSNTRATIVGDLRTLDNVAESSFDCIILTQVLQYIDDLPAAVSHLWRILAPHGVLLASAPCVLPLDPFVPSGSEFWRFTTASANFLFSQKFAPEHLQITAWGNARVGMALVLGMAQQDLTGAELRETDPSVPCGLLVRAAKF